MLSNMRLRAILACIFLVPLVYGLILAGFSLTSTAKTKEPIVHGEPAGGKLAPAAKLELAAEIPNYGTRLLPKKNIASLSEPTEAKKPEAARPPKPERENKPQPTKPVNQQKPKEQTATSPKKAANTPVKQQPAVTPAPVKKTAPVKVTAPGKPRPVYLTFDDGPHRVSGQILDLLDKYNSKATFFLLDPNMKQYPEAVKRMASSGHALGLHGVTHDKKLFYKSSNSVISEMNQARATVKKLTGEDTTLIRTPFGSSPHMTPAYKEAVKTNGYRMWDWTVDSRDWQYRSNRYVDVVIEQVEKQKAGSGAIVILLHERPETLAHLPKLMDYLKKQNFILQPLTEDMQPVQFK
ncbi:polysaccharide deacetylase family protein [Bacillus sp. EB01]|uniref:polysaccharide deacetylase family protein n=1 Tax=Bacillus sp. EB01 TaxID=1347086 RepID=UPI0006942D2B|nr:polysaccharide deacetylase family protein [Bacillus sp. EB01]